MLVLMALILALYAMLVIVQHVVLIIYALVAILDLDFKTVLRHAFNVVVIVLLALHLFYALHVLII